VWLQLHHTGQQGVTIELVENLEDAVTHVNHYGSGHVDSIITKNQQTAKAFAQSVNSACVFHNGMCIKGCTGTSFLAHFGL